MAVESASGFEFIASNKGLVAAATFISAFNTWSTRFVRSTYLIYSGWQLGKKILQSRLAKYATYYNFREDIQKYAHLVDVRFDETPALTDAENLEGYAQQLYTAMKTAGYRPGSSWMHTLKTVTQSVATPAIVSILIVNMEPLWIKLTVHGAETISDGLARSAAFVAYASVSNELFYLNSGFKFMPTLTTFCGRAYNNTINKYGNTLKVIAAFVGVFPLFLGVWAVASYFSGEGYGEDALEAMICADQNMTNSTLVNDTVTTFSQLVSGNSTTPVDCKWPEGFGLIAGGLWFNWMGWVE